tara:strand:+ start:20 stop:244 length:225 start_codon:yes stop_codon:yes gene_type:complete
MNNELKRAFTKLVRQHAIIKQGKNRDTLSIRCRDAIIEFDVAVDTIKALDPTLWESWCRDVEWSIETNGSDIAA